MRISDCSSDVFSSDRGVLAIKKLACHLLVAIDLHRELPDLGDGRDAIALVQGELWCAGALAPRQRRACNETVRKVGVIGGDSFRQPLARGKRVDRLEAVVIHKHETRSGIYPYELRKTRKEDT